MPEGRIKEILRQVQGLSPDERVELLQAIRRLDTGLPSQRRVPALGALKDLDLEEFGLRQEASTSRSHSVADCCAFYQGLKCISLVPLPYGHGSESFSGLQSRDLLGSGTDAIRERLSGNRKKGQRR